MIYRNITLPILSDFVRNLDNLKTIYSTLLLFSYDEVVGFVMLQQNHPNLRSFFTTQHPEVFQSMIDKFASIDCSISRLCLDGNSIDEMEAYDIKRKLDMAHRLFFKAPTKTSKMFHDFETEKQKLVCDMSEQEIIELAKRNDLRTTASFKQNFLNPLVAYMKTEIRERLGSTKGSLLEDDAIKKIDFTSVLTAKDFKDFDELRDYLNDIFPAIHLNIHTNRAYLGAMMAYCGVKPDDILNVRKDDLDGNILHYKNMKIVLPDECMKILEIWKETGYYTMIKSEKKIPLQTTQCLLQSHKSLTAAGLSSLIKDWAEIKGREYYTLRDLYRSGEYDRYHRTHHINVSTSRKKLFLTDYKAWLEVNYPEENQPITEV